MWRGVDKVDGDSPRLFRMLQVHMYLGTIEWPVNWYLVMVHEM
jgi:hypothetical protein